MVSRTSGEPRRVGPMMKNLVATCLFAWVLSPGYSLAYAQDENASGERVDRAAAYYHYSLGHLYSELAAAYGNKGNFLDNAIDNYRMAMDADPDASFLAEELSDLYIQAGRLREAVLDSEAALRADPDDLNARRILGRIYTRLIGDTAQQGINEEMVKKAIEQYEKIVEKEPDSTKIWVLLGRLQKIAQDSLASEAAYKKAIELDPDNEEALVGLAAVYSDLGDHSRASETLEKAVGSDPSVPTLAFLATTYERMNEYALAAEAYRKALAKSPDDTGLKRSLAQSLLYSEKTGEAQAYYEELVAENPGDYISQLRLSQIYRQKRDYSKAWKALNAAKEASPDNLEILYHEVNLFESDNQTDKALDALRALLDSTKKESYSKGEISNRAIFLERLAHMYQTLDRYDEAVETFRKLEELDPSLASRVGAQIGDTYRQGKMYDKAVEAINETYSRFPDDRMVSIVRATILADAGQFDKANAAIEKLTKGEEGRESLLTRAQIYEKTKSFEKMAKAIEAAEALSKTDAERIPVLFMRGAMYERQKMYEEAETAFRAVLKIDPENTSAMNYLGYMFADRNVNLDEALSLISKAVEEEPENGAYLDSLGWVYYRLGRLDEAETYLLRAVQKVSKDPVVHDHLGDLYLRQGELRKAIAQWKIALQEWKTSAASEKDLLEESKLLEKLEGAEVRLAKESSKSPTRP